VSPQVGARSCQPLAMPAIVPHPAASSTWGAPHLDVAGPGGAAAVQARLAAAASDALDALAGRARAAAAEVSTQVAVHRQLLGTDWHGVAARAFTGALEQRCTRLLEVERHLTALADEAARRARLVAEGAL